MYGDCQVLASSMAGAENRVSTVDPSLFSSPIRNHHLQYPSNFSNFMSATSSTTLSFHPFPPSMIPMKEDGGGLMTMMMMGSVAGKDHEIDSLSGGSELHIEGLSRNEQGNIVEGGDNGHRHQQPAAEAAEGTGQPQPPKNKRYHRHTARQIQEMEALFKECPHPDDKQRLKLSQELGLKPRQVKFWFQNRRTQMKAQQDRQDNVILRAENDGLKNENYRLQELMRSLICPCCGGQPIFGEVVFDEQQLRIENARLKEELDRLCTLASRYSSRMFPSMGPPPCLLPPSVNLDMSIYPRHFQEPMPNCIEMIPMPLLPDHNAPFHGGGLLMDKEKGIALELAMSAADELVKMCQLDEPLWMRSTNNGMEILNDEEYARMFSWPMELRQHCNGLRMEATRSQAVVIMNSLNLVDAFLDANKWMKLFPSIVTRAKTIQIVVLGHSGHGSGSLHLMYAELQVLSPLVSTREAHFLRYCQQNAEGSWVIVDFPLDSFHGNLPLSAPKYRRRPSGCVIQDMPNGYSRVTCVEHAELIEEKPVHQIFSHYVNSGMAFGAQRWLAVLQRECERVASLMARNIPDLGVMQSPEARKNLMRLAQRMLRTFCTNISASDGQSWTAVSDSAEDTIRITTRKVTEPGQPNGLMLTAVSTTWLPFPHDQVFQLLRNERHRTQLDALSNGNSLQEVAHIANGSDPGNCISLLRINVGGNSSQNVELMLQESCTDSSGSLIVYTMVEVNYIQLVMSVEDPSSIPLLPVGFSIIPMSTQAVTPTGSNGASASVGCLLTIGHQVHASTVPTAKLNLASVTAITNHIRNAVQQIKAALGGSSSNSNQNSNAIAAAVSGSVSAEPNVSVTEQ